MFYAYSILNVDKQTQIWLFKKIALNCDRLIDYAKKKILKRIFGVYFEFYLRSRSLSQQIFIFRNNKHYMGEKKRGNVSKVITKIHTINNYKQGKFKGQTKRLLQAVYLMDLSKSFDFISF